MSTFIKALVNVNLIQDYFEPLLSCKLIYSNLFEMVATPFIYTYIVCDFRSGLCQSKYFNLKCQVSLSASYSFTSILKVGWSWITFYKLYFNHRQRYQTSYTAPCMVSSSAMGLNLGVFRCFADHTHEQTENKCVHNLRAPCSVLRVFVFRLILQHMQVTHALDKPRLFWLRKNPKTLKLNPMQGSRWCRFWYISGVYLWLQQTLISTHLNITPSM